MSQLRQPGDYLKYNRTGAPQPHIHTFTAEPNQKVRKRKRKIFQKKDTVVPKQRERTVRDSKLESSELDTEKDRYTQSIRERADIQDYA